VFDSMEQFLSIHVRPHPENRAAIRFTDGAMLRPDSVPAC
jgi:hypothetical protein